MTLVWVVAVAALAIACSLLVGMKRGIDEIKDLTRRLETAEASILTLIKEALRMLNMIDRLREEMSRTDNPNITRDWGK